MSKIKTEWDLSLFYDSLKDDRIIKDIEESVSKYNEIYDKYNGRLSELNVIGFKRFLDEENEAGRGLVKAFSYNSYKLSLNYEDKEALILNGKLESIYEELTLKLLFIDDFYGELGYDKIIELSELPELSEYKGLLISIADTRKYHLPSNETKIAVKYSNILNEIDTLYNDYVMSIEFEDNLSKSELYSMRESADYNTRKRANDILYSGFSDKKTQITLASIYKTRCKDNVASMDIFGYEDIMTSNLVSESMELDVVNKLIEKVKSMYPLYHKFLSKKENALGKKMTFHDILAPIGESNMELSFDDAYNMYMEYIYRFDKQFAEISESMFLNGQVDVFPKNGKRSGAFSSSNEGLPSMILMNYTDDLTSLMTMAHELGHSIHGYFSQGLKCCFDAPLPLAETASIFNEALVFDCVKSDIDEDDLEYFEYKYLDSIFATMFRQIMYTDFELEANRRTLDGETLTYEDLNEIWLRKNKELYGEDVEIPEYIKCGWSIVPHLTNTPFYCYSYSFGNILAFNLFNRYKESNDSEFIEMYKDILSKGGTEKPYELLKEKGIDIKGDEFYDEALEYLESLVNKLR